MYFQENKTITKALFSTLGVFNILAGCGLLAGKSQPPAEEVATSVGLQEKNTNLARALAFTHENIRGKGFILAELGTLMIASGWDNTTLNFRKLIASLVAVGDMYVISYVSKLRRIQKEAEEKQEPQLLPSERSLVKGNSIIGYCALEIAVLLSYVFLVK